MRRNLFTDPEDFHARHGDIADRMEQAVHWLHGAHQVPGGSDAWAECLVRAEHEALAANAELVTVLGGGVDPARLLPLVRLAIEAMEHN